MTPPEGFHVSDAEKRILAWLATQIGTWGAERIDLARAGQAPEGVTVEHMEFFAEIEAEAARRIIAFVEEHGVSPTSVLLSFAGAVGALAGRWAASQRKESLMPALQQGMMQQALDGYQRQTEIEGGSGRLS